MGPIMSGGYAVGVERPQRWERLGSSLGTLSVMSECNWSGGRRERVRERRGHLKLYRPDDEGKKMVLGKGLDSEQSATSEANGLENGMEHGLVPVLVKDQVEHELKPIKSEELLAEQVRLQKKAAAGRKAMLRKDSMEDITQTVRDDLGVKVNGIREDGSVSSYEMRSDTKGLLLGGLKLARVNLDTLWQLSHCRLREISLAANRLEKVDLSVVAHCPDLQNLYLQGNQLWSIDLTPLSECRNLEKLWLQGNCLQGIDLLPLKSCSNLRSLYLQNNALSDPLDLSPLKQCTLLRALTLKQNKIAKELDITPLLSCPDLSSFTVDGSVPLVGDAAERVGVPPGLIKHKPRIKWQDTEQVRRTSQNSKTTKLHALLIGFSPELGKDITHMLEKYGSFNVSVFEKSISTVSALKMFDVFVVELPFPREHMEEIRHHAPTTPFVLIGAGEDVANVYPFRADRVFEGKLTARDALDTRDITRKVIDEDVLIWSSPPLEVMTGESGAPNGTVNAALFDFPINEEQRRALDYTLSQSRVEEVTLGKIFEKNDLHASQEIFRHIARVCGLPVASAGILFEVITSDKENHDGLAYYHDGIVDYASFSSFWSARLAGFDPEERLYNVLRRGDERAVRESAIERLVSAFLMERASMFHERLALEFAVEVASACLCFALCGNSSHSRPFTMRELRRGNLSKALIDAENGRYEGVALVLRPDRVEALLALLSTVASKDEELGVSASREEMIKVNWHKELLIPRAVDSVFNRYCNGHDKIGVAGLTRLWIAASEPGARASAEFFFHVLDVDMDGVLAAEDVYHFYKEKESIARSEGFVIADFADTWTYVCDMVGVRESSRRCLRLADITKLSDSSIKFIMQAFLFRNDDMALLNVRRTIDEAGTRVRVTL